VASKGNSVGNLYVSVGANVYPAIKSMRRLDKEVRKTKASIQQIGGSAKSAQKLQKQNSRTAQGFKKTGDAAKKSGDKVKQAGQSSDKTSRSMKKLDKSAAGASSKMGLLSKMSTKAKLGVAGLGLALVGLGATAIRQTQNLATFGVNAAADLEMLRTQYAGLLQDASAARREVDYILELGRTSVVPTEGLLQANRLLLAYGVTQEKTRKDLVNFMSTFGSATAIPVAKLQDMAYALGQIQSQGRANQIDLRQLANAGLSLAGVYEEIAFQQGITVSEARNLSSEGKAYADVVLPAIIAMTKKYESGAEQARKTARGIYANLGDIAKINAGQAFEGLLNKLKPLLEWTEEFIESFDFTAVASGFEAMVQGIQAGFTDIEVGAEDAGLAVGEALGEGFRSFGIKLGEFIVLIRKGLIWIERLKLSLEGLGMWLERGALQLELWGAQAGQAFGNRTQEDVDAVRDKIKALEDAAWETEYKIRDLEQELKDLDKINVTAEVNVIVRQRTIGAQEVINKQASEGKMSGIYEFQDQGLPTPAVEEEDDQRNGGGSSAPKEDPVLKRWQSWLEALRELRKSIRDTQNTLRGLLTEKFGEKSALAEALDLSRTSMGENGQLSLQEGSGGVSSVIAFYDQARNAVRAYYKAQLESDVVDKKTRAALKAARKRDVEALRSYTQELVDLARKQEETQAELEEWTAQRVEKLKADIQATTEQYNADVQATEQYYDQLIDAAQAGLDRATAAYDAANSRLQDMIAERDRFLNGVIESARSFVNKLALANETISEITEIDGLGSFAYTEKQKTQDFKSALRERLTALREWVQGVKSLESQGLDRALLEQLIAAGPESSGDVVRQLAGMDSAGLAEVNSIQGEISSVVGGLQSQLSAAWFDQGISQQQAYVAQQRAAMQAAEANLAAIRAQREQALTDLKNEYDESVRLLNEKLQKVEAYEHEHQQELMTQLSETAKAADEQAQKIHDRLSALSDPEKPGKNLQTVGVQAMRGLIKGLDKMTPSVKSKARAIAGAVRDEITKALRIHSPSRVMMDIGENVGEGLSVGMDSALPKVEQAALRLAGASLPNIDGDGPAAPEVRVFIGDQELRDLVDVQIVDASRMDREFAVSGRRVN